jgi:hypothetical protein
MTFFFNAITKLRHPEEARSAVSKDARIVVQQPPRKWCGGHAPGLFDRFRQSQ